ncbi:MAG: NAD-dependent epimerase/dehydratase family protein [Bacteroidetes bacterium]|nr:NAD-dependent epimerase/dehydratase family protein [Bacteroidota bacterium]
MKIAVTGATGYIGAHLVKYLAEQGHMVHALVRSVEKGQCINRPQVILFEGDILDTESLQRCVNGCDQVYHLAAFAKVWAQNSKTFFDLNVTGTLNVLNAAAKAGVQRTVVTSTAGVFGPSMEGSVTESHVRSIDFFNEYESSKALSESRIKDCVVNGQDVVIVSPTRVYGPYLFGKPESVTLLAKKYVQGSWRFIPGNGSKFGNYVFVEDVVKGHVLAMEKGVKGNTYLLGGENHTYTAFFNTLAECSGIRRKMVHMPDAFQMLFARLQLVKTWFGKEPLITPKWVAKGKYDWHVTAEKARLDLGLKPTPLREGLQKTVDWIKKSADPTAG